MILNVGEDWRPDIDGWSVDILPFYARMAKQLPDGAAIAEIGVFHGRSILYLATCLWELGKRNCELYAVDTWDDRPTTLDAHEHWDPKSRKIFDRNLESIGDAKRLIFPLSLSSSEAAKWFSGTRATEKFPPKEFALVFLDGAHDYASVKADIEAWKPLMSLNGTLAGHDYWNWGEHEGVGRAVDEAFPDVVTCGSVWWRDALDFPPNRQFKTRDELVSIIIPCMGQAQYLEDAYASVRDQTYPNIELLFACGDEESVKEVIILTSPVAAQSFRITLLSGPPYAKGRGLALNSAIEHAKGKYIFRLDADDMLLPDAIEKLVAATPSDEAFTITTCNAQKFGAENGTLITAPFFARNQLHNNYILSGSLFTKRLWRAILLGAGQDGFPQSLCDYEDWSFWISCLPLLPVISKVNEKLFQYRIHGEQATVFASKHDDALRAMVRMLNPNLYGESPADEAILRSAAEPLKEKVRRFSAWFPEDPSAQRFGRLVAPPMPSTVCLVMICKNEERTIARALASVKEHIDSWVIVDTGSTDRTKDIILETLAFGSEGSAGIPGYLLDFPWINFGHNRTQAIQEAARLFPNDYLLILDADDTIEAETGTFKRLTAPAYQIKLVHQGGSPTYWKTHLIRADGDWRYEGVTHEVLVSPSNLPTTRLIGPLYHCNNDGARATDPRAKFLQDAELLEEQHARIPEDNRTLFYLAQSYRDAEETQKALEAYRKRVQAGGWDEEVYQSLYNIALLYEGMGMGAFITSAYLAAWQYRPSRAEPLYRLAAYHRSRREWALAYLFASHAVQIPSSADNLFVDESVVQWRCKDELAVAASWTGRTAEAVSLFRDLLSSGKLPESERERANQYLQSRPDF